MNIESNKSGYGHLLKGLVKLGDLLTINLFFVIIYLFFNQSLLDNVVLQRNELEIIFLLINLSYFITRGVIYEDISSNILFFDRIIQKAVSFISLYSLLLFLGISLFSIIDISWSSLLIIYMSLLFIYSFWHIIFRLLLKSYRKRGYNYKRVLIIGGGLNGINIYNVLASNVYGYKVLGYFDDNPNAKGVLPPYLGCISQVEDYCRTHKIDEIYCTLPGNQEAKILGLMNFAENRLIRFYLVPEFYKYIKRRLVLKSFHTIPIVAIREEPLMALQNRILKRSFDVIFSLTVLLTIFPVVYLIFGSIIKLTSRGPIFFTQKRTGLGGEVFDCYKFRSMRINKDADVKATTKADPRITWIGAFMRKTSIDELPQFINVLLGNMSVVGPRPHMIQQTELYLSLIDKFMIRHLVKPGITGWAQVSGFRGETKTIDKMEGRFRRDMWYIENWSFFLDIKIIFVTILNVFRGEENAF